LIDLVWISLAHGQNKSHTESDL